MKKTLQMTGFTALILFISAGICMAQGYGLHRHGFGHRLTDDQRTEVHALVSQMNEEGASDGEIQIAVDELLVEWGVEAPIDEGAGKGIGRHSHPRFMRWLTDDQRAEIHALTDRMRADGASRQEVREAVDEMLEGWGIEVPFRKGRGPCGGRSPGGMNEPLDEQILE